MPEIKKILGKNPSLNSFARSFAAIKGHILEFPIPILSDLFFPFVYGFLIGNEEGGFMMPLIIRQMFAFGIEITKTEQQTASLSEIMFQESARPILIKVAALLLLMILLIYIIYCLFQGFSWWYCSKIALKRKEPFSAYLKSFYRTNVYWYAIVVLYSIIAFAGDNLFWEGWTKGTFFTVLLFIFIYFVIISYSLLPGTSGFNNIKKSFRIGIRKSLDILPAYITMLAILFIISSLFTLNFLINYSISNVSFIVIAVFILMPFLSWARIYSIMVVEKAKINKS